MKKIILILILSTFHFQQNKAQDSKEISLNTVVEIDQYFNSKQLTRKNSREAFNNIKTLSENGDSDATCLLGVFYKDGIGTSLNFNKARKEFEKAYQQGNSKGAYSLGYLHLKGLGNIEQNYATAISWFKNSDYPMSVHWLAKMNYFGLGMPVDRDKAIQMLSENPIGNSQILLGKLRYEMDSSIENSTELDEDKKSSIDLSLFDIEENYNTANVIGDWSGYWTFMDWSNNSIIREVLFSMEVTENFIGSLDVEIKIDGQKFNGQLVQVGNELVFSNMIIQLKNDYNDYVDEPNLEYRLTSLLFKTVVYNNTSVIKGNVEAMITNWAEPLPPNSLILESKNSIINAKILEAISNQSEHFIKVYPNPFKEDLLLYYSLNNDSDVSIKLSNYFQPTEILKNIDKKQQKGERTITLDGLDKLKSGLYIVNMSVNNNSYSRIVIKE